MLRGGLCKVFYARHPHGSNHSVIQFKQKPARAIQETHTMEDLETSLWESCGVLDTKLGIHTDLNYPCSAQQLEQPTSLCRPHEYNMYGYRYRANAEQFSSLIHPPRTWTNYRIKLKTKPEQLTESRSDQRNFIIVVESRHQSTFELERLQGKDCKVHTIVTWPNFTHLTRWPAKFRAFPNFPEQLRPTKSRQTFN